MKNQIIYLILIALTAFTFSCSNDDEADVETTINFDGATTCEFGPSGGGICLDGFETVIPGETYTYAFKISKRENGNNINQVVNWIVESGEIEITSIETTLMDEFTISVSTIKFGNDFNGGIIKASSDRYNVDSPIDSSFSAITYSIDI